LQEAYDKFDLQRDVFLVEGIPDARHDRFKNAMVNYNIHCVNGNVDYCGVANKTSSDKYWENFNHSFADYCNIKTNDVNFEKRKKWFDVNHMSYRMIKPSLSNAYKSFAKYDRPQYAYDRAAMNLAHEWTKRHFMPALMGSKVLDFDPVYDDLVKTTASGYPYGLRWPTKKLVPRDVVQKVCDFYWDDLAKDNISYVPIWTCSQKRELRSAEKIAEGKIRTFTASSFEQTICMNRLCQDMNEKFYANHLNNWSFVGGTKFLGGWQRLYEHLDVGGKFPLAYELDESNYDCSLQQDLMYGQADIRWEFLHSSYKTEENRRRLWHLYDNAIYSLIVMEDGSLLRKNTGNPSGSANTISDNTMILFKLFAYAYIKLAPEDFMSYSQFMRNVRAALNGDDNTFTTTEAVKDWFNPPNIRRIWGEIGVITKTPCDEARKLSEVEFLSQSFKKVDGMWLPSPETNRVLCSLLWASKKADVRWHFLRACALRMDSWANEECNQILSGYIEYLTTSIWRDQLCGVIDGMPIEEIFNLWRSDKWCRALYTGSESEMRVISGNARLPHKKLKRLFDNLIEDKSNV